MITELWETIKKPFLKDPEPEILSSDVKNINVINDLSGSDYTTSMSFFDNSNTHGMFSGSSQQNLIERQRQKLLMYRDLAMNPDVSDAIEEIVNEVSFSLDDEIPLKIDINEESKAIKDKISESFDKVNKLMKTKKNLFNLVRTAYVDGQLVLHIGYSKDKPSEGIKSIKIIDPSYLVFDAKRKVYKYETNADSNYLTAQSSESQEFSPEEIVRVDFGLYKDGLTLSYLEGALKTANQLRALEDLLVPLRFSRSISRRVFNVDIGDLPNKKGEEVMKDIQNKFKYKKFYNADTGEVTNQQHIMSMVEDYWFANRSGGKGTEVSTLDESGNLGELDDILYFYKKLYKAMKIPSNRIPNLDDSGAVFDYDTTAVSKEDMKFFIFISRLRQVFSDLYKTVLKYEIISTGTLSADEYEEYDDKIRVYFVNENAFIKKMHTAEFMAQLDSWNNAKEFIGKVFSVEELYMKIFRMNVDDMKEEFGKITKEEADKMYTKFYTIEE